MHHHHTLSYEPGKRGKILTQVTWVGLLANVFITSGKLLAGWLGHSSAMVSSGIHSLSDLASDTVVLILLSLSAKGENRRYAFGRGKFEAFASMVIGVVLFYVAVDLLVDGLEAIEEILSGNLPEKPSLIALWAAGASICIQAAVYLYTSMMGHKYDSPTLIAKSWHNLVDALSTFGALTAVGLAIFLGDKWVILDPLAGCIISVAVLVLSVKVLIPALGDLLDRALPAEEEQHILSTLRSAVQTGNGSVREVTRLKTRRSGPAVFVEACLVVAPGLSAEEACACCRKGCQALKTLLGDNARISLTTDIAG